VSGNNFRLRGVPVVQLIQTASVLLHRARSWRAEGLGIDLQTQWHEEGRGPPSSADWISF
jgi:hypothetical protein